MSRVLVIGDTHFPFTHPLYLDFVRGVQEGWKCDRVIHIGDVYDHLNFSRYAREPDEPSAFQEIEETFGEAQRWRFHFPSLEVLVGNHDARIAKQVRAVGVPEVFLLSLNDLFETPDWTWQWELEIDGVHLEHGDGAAGQTPAWTLARKLLTSVAIGHTHTKAGVRWMQNSRGDRICALDVGCGVDDSAVAFNYARLQREKSVLGCGVILDGVGHFVPMPKES